MRLTIVALSLILVVCGCASNPSKVNAPVRDIAIIENQTSDPLWIRKEDARARAFLEQRKFDSLRRQVDVLASREVIRSGLQVRQHRLFFLLQYPNARYADLAFRDGLHGLDHVFFQPKIDGHSVAIGDFDPNPSGTLIAVTMYLNDEWAVTQIVDVSGAAIFTLPGLVAATAWIDDQHLLYAEGHTLRLLRIGSTFDVPLFRQSRAWITHVEVASTRHRALIVADVTGREDQSAVYLFDLNSRIAHQICGAQDDVEEAKFIGETPVVMSRHDSDLNSLFYSSERECLAKPVTRHVNMPIYDFFPVRRGLLVEYLNNGDARLHLFHLGNSAWDKPVVPPGGPFSVNEVAIYGHGVLLSIETWYTDPAWFQLTPTGTVLREDSGALVYSKALFDAIEVGVPSADGKALIPLTILRRHGLVTSRRTKTILYGYGANGWLSGPKFEGSLLAWVRDGGVFAQARIRGGGDRGRDWHIAATGVNKIRSAQDLFACARWLGEHGYGDSRHLGLYAISTGAYIAAVALTEKPRMFAAAFLKSGLYDQIGVDSTEIGVSSNAGDLPWIIRRSPYQRLKRIQVLPALFLIHGADDMVYSAQQSRSFIDEALTTHPHDRSKLLYMEMPGEGHGRTDSYQQRIAHSFWLQAFFTQYLEGPRR